MNFIIGVNFGQTLCKPQSVVCKHFCTICKPKFQEFQCVLQKLSRDTSYFNVLITCRTFLVQPDEVTFCGQNVCSVDHSFHGFASRCTRACANHSTHVCGILIHDLSGTCAIRQLMNIGRAACPRERAPFSPRLRMSQPAATRPASSTTSRPNHVLKNDATTSCKTKFQNKNCALI